MRGLLGDAEGGPDGLSDGAVRREPLVLVGLTAIEEVKDRNMSLG
jgi:hypothetical protein